MADDTGTGPFSMQLDTNTVAALIVLGALAFLLLIRRGFRGFVVQV